MSYRTLTRSKKIKILQYALGLIEDESDCTYNRGLCYYIETAELEFGFYHLNLLPSLPEYGIKERRKKYGAGSYWWPREKSGRVLRIRALKTAISKLKKN